MAHRPNDPTTDPATAGQRLWSPAAAGIVVALVGLLITAGLWHAAAMDTNDDVAAELDRIAQEVETQVNRRVEVAESALLTMAAQVSTGAADSREIQWVLANTAVVEELPGMLAMLYAEATTTEDGLRVAPAGDPPPGAERQRARPQHPAGPGASARHRGGQGLR